MELQLRKRPDKTTIHFSPMLWIRTHLTEVPLTSLQHGESHRQLQETIVSPQVLLFGVIIP